MPALRPGEGFASETLPAPAAALAAYAAACPLAAVAVERVPLAAAAGRVLAASVVAGADEPAGARSTMDGFAVRAADGAAPRRLAGEVRMGRPPAAALGPGEAQRIPTGGLLPEGADAVLPLEDARLDGDRVVPDVVPEAGRYVTARGADMRAGEDVLRAGRRIGAAELGVLATLGVREPAVYRRPRAAIVSTGDELVEAAATPGPGQIRDSNRWAIGATLSAAGFDLVPAEHAPDDLAALVARLRAALAVADAVLLTGGSSVGERDLTPEAIEALGGTIAVHGIRLKPGKPTVLASVGGTPVIGLPGNPASALIVAHAIAVPALLALTGAAPAPPLATRARAAADFPGRPGWTWYVPARLRFEGGAWSAAPLPLRSAFVSLLARADGYVVVAPAAGGIPAGAEVDVVPLARNGANPAAVVGP